MLQLEFQNYLEMVFDKQYLNREQVQEILEINSRATDSLCKTLNKYKRFYREYIIRPACGGKTIESEVEK